MKLAFGRKVVGDGLRNGWLIGVIDTLYTNAFFVVLVNTMRASWSLHLCSSECCHPKLRVQEGCGGIYHARRAETINDSRWVQ